ncbi:zinc-dependent metalloprotease [Streptomyces chartreusis]|uniref:zinc-dependent metalloprotease n=1 Tax=Streptomyces TaxID=1883 RepID=UPI000F73DACB|nr:MULTISPECIES: zinc-dependent metalloprotease [Streptomyces]MBT1095588.1 zinc-dependent metalloprotease [Streptomyces sp. Tu102]RSN86624.1 hydrolase [Streptomyces sp. WAC 05379]WSZ67111.1 zinc-dependent metalloprotease [Streptomyces chartreusis]WTA30040.1 zinc-dependent metalloprotease [Streptomyces chartreusis]WUB20524.1 zinc-dependent metalloprotease [Streptomyces chartreusis]
MSDTPFGFGLPPEEPEDGDEGKKKDQQSGGGQGPANPFGFGGLPGAGGFGSPGADNPFAAMFGSLNPTDLGAAFQQLGQMLSYEGGPVNWDMAKQIARQTVSQGTADGTKDASVGASERTAVQEAVRLADLWLDDATSLPSGANTAVAWSRAEWVEATLPAWQELVDPVAERVGTAMGDVLPEEMQAMAGPLIGMMRSMGGAMFGTQIGQAVGVLAGEVVGSTDIGLPLGPAGKAALLPVNIETFGKDLGVPKEEVRLYLALREAAHQRLFAHVPWLRSHLFGAVDGYARGIKVDTAKLEDVVGQFDPQNPEQLQDALQQGMFQPEDTPEQKAALARLETALALVEGWVDAVVHAAAKPRLSSADALRETLRRRRASGGPAEQTFATLIGLELRPRRLRDASRLWASLTDARGVDGRDALWAHPDMLPTAGDLDDPDGFVHREQIDFSELDKMLGEAASGGGEKPNLKKDDDSEGGDAKGDGTE